MDHKARNTAVAAGAIGVGAGAAIGARSIVRNKLAPLMTTTTERHLQPALDEIRKAAENMRNATSYTADAGKIYRGAKEGFKSVFHPSDLVRRTAAGFREGLAHGGHPNDFPVRAGKTLRKIVKGFSTRDELDAIIAMGEPPSTEVAAFIRQHFPKRIINKSHQIAGEADEEFVKRMRLRTKINNPTISGPQTEEHMSARSAVLVMLKAMDLGHSYEGVSESPSSKHYPCIYVNDREEPIDLPLSGHAHVKYKLRSKTARQDESGKVRHSADIEIHSMDPIIEEKNEPVEGEHAKLLSADVVGVIQFIMNLNPKNKGKFTKTQKKTGKSTVALRRSKNKLTASRANFALLAKRHWKPLPASMKKGKTKQMSARDELQQIIQMGSLPGNIANVAEGQGVKGVKSVIDELLRKNKPLAAGAIVKRKFLPGDTYYPHIIREQAPRHPISGIGSLSAKLDGIISMADPRPRNTLGMFSGNDQSPLDPNAIGAVYKQPNPVNMNNLEGGAVAGVGAAGSGMALKALVNKVKKARGAL